MTYMCMYIQWRVYLDTVHHNTHLHLCIIANWQQGHEEEPLTKPAFMTEMKITKVQTLGTYTCTCLYYFVIALASLGHASHEKALPRKANGTCVYIHVHSIFRPSPSSRSNDNRSRDL